MWTASSEAAGVPWAKRETGYLKAADGTWLHYSVLLPKATGRFPVVMNYSGYDAGSIGGMAYRDGNTAMWPRLDATLLQHGYAVFGVNMPGTGCSGGGAFNLFDHKWGVDGGNAVEWAARQRWSTGSVGMADWSYAGLSQIMVAEARPKHLRAIAPGMVVTDPQRDVGALSGVPNTLFPVGWWAYIQTEWGYAKTTAEAEHDTRCLANIKDHLAKSVNTSPPVEQKLHPFADASDAQRETWSRANRIDVPVLSLEDWQDEATGVRGGYYQRYLDPARTWYVGTNGEHDIYTSLRWRALLVRYFDHFLKGRNNGFQRGDHVQIWEDTSAPGGLAPDDMQLERSRPAWIIDVPRLPVPVKPLTLALNAGGTLSSQRATGHQAPSRYTYPVAGPDVNDPLDPTSDQWQNKPVSVTGSLSFTTAPLTHDVTLFGSASADLWVSSTATDSDLQVTISEVRPDGQEEYVQRGWLRLSQRAIDPRYSTAFLPWHPQTRASVSLLTPGVPVLARVEIQKFSHAFRKGSSIRIWIDAPSTTGEEGFTGLQTPATNEIWTDPGHPSRVIFGQLAGAPKPRPLPKCNTLIYEPCRRNPVPVPRG
jgi:predicted acyl esterase